MRVQTLHRPAMSTDRGIILFASLLLCVFLLRRIQQIKKVWQAFSVGNGNSVTLSDRVSVICVFGNIPAGGLSLQLVTVSSFPFYFAFISLTFCIGADSVSYRSTESVSALDYLIYDTFSHYATICSSVLQVLYSNTVIYRSTESLRSLVSNSVVETQASL